MKKTIDERTGRKIVVYNKYNLNGADSCPECGRILDENDYTLLEQLGKRSCKKCGSILVK